MFGYSAGSERPLPFFMCRNIGQALSGGTGNYLKSQDISTYRVSCLLLRLVALLCLALVAGCHSGRAVWMWAGDAGALDRMISAVRETQVVFVGEYHDQRANHQLQLQVLKSLQAQGIPLAIGMEMFDIEAQAALDEWVAGKLALFDFVKIYKSEWTVNWAEYDSILLFARNSGIPLVALNAPQAIVRKVARSGFSSLGARELSRLPPDLAVTADRHYRSYLEDALEGHGMNEQRGERLIQAQALRDATMARMISCYVARNPGKPMVVISGIGHAMRHAVPARLMPPTLRTSIIIPVREGRLPGGVDNYDGDYFVAE